MERGIWWLASYPKSGNTWMRMLLNSYIAGVPANINSAFQVVQSDVHSTTYQATAAKAISELPVEHMMAYRPAALANMVHMAKVRDPILKTHFANKTADGFPCIPECLTRGAIYIVRDPRDVAISFASHINKPLDYVVELMLTSGARMKAHDSELFYCLDRWDEHYNTWSNGNIPTLIVRYEDMLHDTSKILSQVVEFMGTKPDRNRIESAVKYAKFDRLREQEDASGFVESTHGKFFRVGKSGQWRKNLPLTHRNALESGFAQTMHDLDYL